MLMILHIHKEQTDTFTKKLDELSFRIFRVFLMLSIFIIFLINSVV